jgi:hypothetical protein
MTVAELIDRWEARCGGVAAASMASRALRSGLSLGVISNPPTLSSDLLRLIGHCSADHESAVQSEVHVTAEDRR